MYICCKKYEKTNLKRKPAIVNYGKKLESDRKFIYLDGDPLMMAHSQDARDYFSKNDDGNGRERFSLVHEILSKVAEVPAENKDALWQALDEDTPVFRTNGVWNDLFYDAEITDLEDTLSIVERFL